MKSICIITTAHPPDDVRVTHRIGRSFTENGYKVTWVGPESGFNNSIYDIKFIFYKKSQTRNVFSNALRLKKVLNTIPRHDIYFAVDPDSAVIGTKIAKQYKAKSIFDIHERYHDDIVAHVKPTYIRKFLSFLIYQLMVFAIKKTDLVIGVGITRLNPYKKYLKDSLIIRHCLPKDFVSNKNIDSTREDKTINIIHGKYAKTRGTIEIIEAIEIIKNKSTLPVKFHFYKLGGAQAKSNLNEWNQIINEKGISEMVVLHENQPFDEMMEQLRKMDIGLITYSRDMGVNAMPNRYFEYIAFGIPSIIPNYSIELTELNKKYNLSVETNMENPQKIADTIIKLINDHEKISILRNNNLKVFSNELYFEKEIRKLYKWIEDNDC